MRIPLWPEIPTDATVVGVGFDITENTRFAAVVQRFGSRLEKRLLHPEEVRHHGSNLTPITLQRAFAFKEAAIKGLAQVGAYPDAACLKDGVLLEGRLATAASQQKIDGAYCRFTADKATLQCNLVFLRRLR